MTYSCTARGTLCLVVAQFLDPKKEVKLADCVGSPNCWLKRITRVQRVHWDTGLGRTAKGCDSACPQHGSRGAAGVAEREGHSRPTVHEQKDLVVAAFLIDR